MRSTRRRTAVLKHDVCKLGNPAAREQHRNERQERRESTARVASETPHERVIVPPRLSRVRIELCRFEIMELRTFVRVRLTARRGGVGGFALHGILERRNCHASFGRDAVVGGKGIDFDHVAAFGFEEWLIAVAGFAVEEAHHAHFTVAAADESFGFSATSKRVGAETQDDGC